jgi:replication factor C subunit 2/4
MRNAVNNLQAIHISTGAITKENVFHVCDVPSKDKTERMFKKLLNGDLDGGIEDFELLWNENYCLHDLVIYIARTCERIDDIENDLKSEMMDLVGNLMMDEIEGIISKTIFLSFLTKICQLGIMYCK